MDLARTKAKLLSRAELLGTGRGETELRRDLARGTLHRVHVGWYVLGEHWTAAYAEERHLMQVLAVADRLELGDTVVCGPSAGVLHGLPFFRTELDRVHVVGHRTDGSLRTSRGIARHRAEMPEADRTEVCGIPCTTLDRTVFDLIRSLSLEAAVAVADAALRRVAWYDRERRYDEERAAAWKAGMRQRLDAAAGARGIRQARWVIEFADGRAQLPGESVSRLQIHRLGFRPPLLQVRVPAPSGPDYAVDFFFTDADGFGEFDGLVKYHDLRLSRGAPSRLVFDAEKAREDWIRGTTQRPMARWGAAHIGDHHVLGTRLAKFGFRPPGA